MKSILYLYTSGRCRRIEDSRVGRAPRDFLYGYTYLEEQGAKVSYLETDYCPHQKLNPKYWSMLSRNKKFAKELGIGNRSHYFLRALDSFNQYDVIIATTDSIALGLAGYKRNGQLNSNILYLNMGLAGTLERMRREDCRKYRRFRNWCSEDLKQMRIVWSAGKGEAHYFASEFSCLRENFVYSPWGVDTQFWQPDRTVANKRETILFVGNDQNRNYTQLLEISRLRPNIEFIFVSSKIAIDSCGPNVRLYQGSLTNQAVSDVELRELYNQAALIILPLHDSLQPSGQSVSFQAMACGRPVAITETSGLWDPESVKDGENCFLVTNGVQGFVELIDSAIDQPIKFDQVGCKARQDIVKYHDGERFAMWMNDCIERNF